MAQRRTSSEPRGIVETVDPIWQAIRGEAEKAMQDEPGLGSFFFATILAHDSLEEAVCHRLARRLDNADVDVHLISRRFQQVLERRPELGEVIRADLSAVRDRDPACNRYIEPLLYFKGFHALATHRFANEMWRQGYRDFAFFLQSLGSQFFGVDIHPAAHFGKGIMLDHATGFVVGETAVIGDNCSFLHGVTLGGSGKETGDRHPKLGNNVLIGAGAKVLGNINVGNCSRIAAGSVVLADVPQNTTVAGVPARVVGPAGCSEPARNMDQGLASDDCGCA
ncbi:MAG: serine O-acetyltransferase [Hyphomicrobiaceae bacterium]|nr:serine O-acetyltransferase [Hyphomicrobiaceae bacterium]MCC0006805.1 serine O-acetyltransferase [Hyphomicrobiaceae bacterium]